MSNNRIIEFEDHGQDFLRWEIDSLGKIINCWPCQASIWCKYIVMNVRSLEVGGMARICKLTRLSFTKIDVNDLIIKYPINNISEGEINDPNLFKQKEVKDGH
jgi:hypothetical protein